MVFDIQIYDELEISPIFRIVSYIFILIREYISGEELKKKREKYNAKPPANYIEINY